MAHESGARAATNLSGELRSRPVAVLLAGSRERGTSGTFTFRHGTRTDVVTMRAGNIAGVRTSDPVAYLGGVLYELGAIDAATRDATLLEVARERQLHGAILLERRAVTQTQLDDALAEQTFRRVEHLFSLPEEATWSFRDDVDDLLGARDEKRPAIDTWPAIWRGLRALPPAPHVHRTLAKIEGQVHIRELRDVQRFALAPDEMALCVRLHAQPSTRALLVASSPLARDRTELLLYLLALARCIVRIETQLVGPAELGVQGVRDRSARIDDEDPLAVLGLRPGASPEAARAAYFRLARLWHPDKLPPPLAEVRSECQHVFARLSEAHRIINGMAAMRRATGAQRMPASPTSDSAPATPPSMRDVDAALARGDFVSALSLARGLAQTGAEGPSARAVIAWCTLEAAATEPGALEQALGILEKVLTGDPECVRALFYRAQIAKRLGRLDMAARDFKRVARLDPRNLDAVREVRLNEMRGRTGSGENAVSRRTGSATNMPKASPSSSKLSAEAPPSTRALDSISVRSGLRRLLARVAGKSGV